MDPVTQLLPLPKFSPPQPHPIHDLTKLALFLIPYLNQTDIISFYLCGKLTKKMIGQYIKFKLEKFLNQKLNDSTNDTEKFLYHSSLDKNMGSALTSFNLPNNPAFLSQAKKSFYNYFAISQRFNKCDYFLMYENFLNDQVEKKNIKAIIQIGTICEENILKKYAAQSLELIFKDSPEMMPPAGMKFLRNQDRETISHEHWLSIMEFYLNHDMVEEALCFIKRNNKTNAQGQDLHGFKYMSDYFMEEEKFIEALDYAVLIHNPIKREEQFAAIARQALDRGFLKDGSDADQLLKEGCCAAQLITLPEIQEKTQKDISVKTALHHLKVFSIEPYLNPLFLDKKRDRKSEEYKKSLKRAIKEYLRAHPLNIPHLYKLNQPIFDEQHIYTALIITYLNHHLFSEAIDITLLFSSITLQAATLNKIISHMIEAHKLNVLSFNYSTRVFYFKNEEQKSVYNCFLEAYQILKEFPSKNKLPYLQFIEKVKLSLLTFKD